MPQSFNESELSRNGLNARDIAIHQRRIKSSLEKGKASYIPIIDSFRLDNGGILPQTYYHADLTRPADGFVAFVPAAGAASRYFQPLQTLRQALAEDDAIAIRAEVSTLQKAGARNWPLPSALKALLHTRPEQDLPSLSDLAAALDEIGWPKALLPFEPDRGSFLEKKREEHRATKGLVGEVYVAPLGCSQVFAEHLGAEAKGIRFLEQGPELSTLRFTREGEPYRDAFRELSMVPAGHGMLVRLFPDIRRTFPKAHSLFIRNIDNVIQDEAACLSDTDLFLRQHQCVLEGVKAIRHQLETGTLIEAAKIAEAMHKAFKPQVHQTPDWFAGAGSAERTLWSLLLDVFHCPLVLASKRREQFGDHQALTQLFHRPLNALGQVPNNGKDVGGSPVRARHEDGEVAICLELPHASDEDRKAFLENPKVATHFNPVFVAAEIPEDDAVYDLEQCPFWILAEKSVHGVPVVYHEIVLYEVLGNSYTANVIFPEIPRRLFNPHKTLLDGLKKA